MFKKMNYICNSSFWTIKGHWFNFDDKISQWEYKELSWEDQRHFEEENPLDNYNGANFDEEKGELI